MAIIGIIGPRQSGKSTLTRHLVEYYGFTRTAFADPIKKALMAAFGLSRDQVYGDLKEEPTDKLCGRTPRHAMMTLGTEWGRELIDPNIWLSAWKNTRPKGNIVIEDVRFPNEHKLIKELGGIIIRVRRPGYEYDPSHESEAHGELEYDHEFINDNDLNFFFEESDLLLQKFLKLEKVL